MNQIHNLNTILFNYGLAIAFDERRIHLHQEDLLIAHNLPRLTTTRYADDILLYTKSLDELISIAESLCHEMNKNKLSLNY